MDADVKQAVLKYEYEKRAELLQVPDRVCALFDEGCFTLLLPLLPFLAITFWVARQERLYSSEQPGNAAPSALD